MLGQVFAIGSFDPTDPFAVGNQFVQRRAGNGVEIAEVHQRLRQG
jgi:hypothetical protein